MGLIKVESFSVDAADAATYALTNDVGNLSDAFIRRTGPSDHASGGPVGNTGNAGPNTVHVGVDFTATNQLTWRRGSGTGTSKITGEVWRYTGSPGGAAEFICRAHTSITLTTGSNSQAIAGITDRNKCIPFITGVRSTLSGTSDYDDTTVSAYIDASNNLVVSRRSGATASIDVYVDVVEFTGSNWSVGHGVSSNHDAAAENVTLNTDSTGTGGSTFSTNPVNAMLELNMAGDNGGESGISDVLVVPTWVSNSVVQFNLQNGDGGARNDNTGYIHVFSNPNMEVFRATGTNISEGNNSFGTVAWPSGAPTNRLIDELSLEWFSDTSGVGTAHGRGRLNAQITAATGTIQHWVHRSGNNVNVAYGVVDLTGVDGTIKPVIDSLSIGNIPITGANNIVITGSNFEAVQGTGVVEISNNPTYGAGTVVTQSVDTWSDTSIQFDFVQGALGTDQLVYVWVTNDSGTRNTSGFSIFFGNPSYLEIIRDTLSQIPDHYIPFHTNYTEELGGIPGSTRTGAPTFTGPALTRGAGGSLEFNASTDGARMNDSNNINLNAETTRSLMCWIQLTELPTAPTCFYEEGGSVNNLAFFLNPGGALIAQFADSGDDNVHAFSNFKLEVGRTYCCLFEFDYTEAVPADRLWKLFVDGVEQTESFGNPLTSTNLDAHSGDISFGLSESNLEVFGTDVAFPGGVNYWSDFASWRQILPDTEKRVQMFELGAIPDLQITGGTQAAMQLQVDAIANTTRANAASAIEVQASTDGDFTLTFDNITFNEFCSIDVQYTGSDTLTIIKENGTDIDPAKVSTPYGGTVIIEEAVTVLVTVQDINTFLPLQDARVYIEADAGGPLAQGTVLLNELTDVNGQASFNLQYSADQPIVGRVRRSTTSPLYKTAPISGTITNTGLTTTVLLIPDE